MFLIFVMISHVSENKIQHTALVVQILATYFELVRAHMAAHPVHYKKRLLYVHITMITRLLLEEIAN